MFEFDPRLCPACGLEMKVIFLITEPDVIDALLRDVAETGGQARFGGRSPPAV